MPTTMVMVWQIPAMISVDKDETVDTDGDGIGNNEDTDDDGDGVSEGGKGERD